MPKAEHRDGHKFICKGEQYDENVLCEYLGEKQL